ncbi:hypothetical protein PIB30_102431 [Stylosanthes scabra]|uniref:Uncharacterized protein n=1 Tax=Stylosanthes scabra TaxID=79078 RepID=A0ABU6XX99_9FABA|nr:hypothetical protein [Stylosanthes scabra]
MLAEEFCSVKNREEHPKHDRGINQPPHHAKTKSRHGETWQTTKPRHPHAETWLKRGHPLLHPPLTASWPRYNVSPTRSVALFPPKHLQTTPPPRHSVPLTRSSLAPHTLVMSPSPLVPPFPNHVAGDKQTLKFGVERSLHSLLLQEELRK